MNETLNLIHSLNSKLKSESLNLTHQTHLDLLVACLPSFHHPNPNYQTLNIRNLLGPVGFSLRKDGYKRGLAAILARKTDFCGGLWQFQRQLWEF